MKGHTSMQLRRFLLVASLLSAFSPHLLAQVSGAITSSQCVQISVTNQATVGIQVTGTWSGTLQPEISIQGQAPQNIQVTPTSSSTAQATITANGLFQARVAGGTTFLLCGNTVASGTANVFLNATQAVSLNGIGNSAASVPWSGVTAGSNTNALTMGSGGNFSPLNIGQVAGSQMWLAAGLSAPTFSCSNTGGSILAGQNIQLAYTLNTGAGATLGSVQVTSGVLNGCSGTTISVTVNAPTQPSGYTGWTAYYCNASGSPSCTAPVQVASCINITGNCVITSPTNGTTALPTINTAWIQPPNIQADPFPIHGMQPSIFETEADGNNYPVAGVDFAACAPLLSPCGVLTWTRPFFVNDTGVNIGESAPDIGVMKNNLFSVSHVMGHYTNNATGNDDRAVGIRTSTPSTTVGAFGRLLGVYEETIINGKPTSFSASPDTGAIGIRAVIGDDRDTSSGAGLTSPMVALEGSYQFTPSAGTNWNVGSCGPCGIGVRGTAGFDTNGINGGGLGLAGVYGQVTGSASGSNVFGADFWADPPTVAPQSGFMAFFGKGGMPTSAGNWFLRSDTGGMQSIVGGTFFLPSIATSQSTIGVTGSESLTGAITTAQLAVPTATATCHTSGATSFSFTAVARDSNGAGVSSSPLNANSCASDITATNFVQIPNIVSAGASSYDIYFTNAGGGTCNGGACVLGKVGTCTPSFAAASTQPACTFQYTGAAGDGTSAPTTNTTGGIVGYNFGTLTNCAAVGSAASPSVAACGSASAGSFSCATNATGATCRVNTTAVTANSQIFVQEDETLGTRLGVTCNTSTNVLPASRLLNARVAATSFTINLGTVTTNPACFSYFLVN